MSTRSGEFRQCLNSKLSPVEIKHLHKLAPCVRPLSHQTSDIRIFHEQPG